MLEVPFENTKLSADEELLLTSGIKKLQETVGCTYIASRNKAGLIEGGRYRGVTFIPIPRAFTRPSLWDCIVLIPTHEKILLVTAVDSDFVELVKILQLTETDEIVFFYGICHRWYSVYEQAVRPVRLSKEDPLICAIKHLNIASDENTTYWWLRWGGYIVEFFYTEDKVFAKFVARNLGDYKTIPR